LRSLHPVNREDRDRVRRFILLNEARLAREEEALALLSARIERCRLLEAGEFPANVVTLDSQVRMRDADSRRSYLTTVSLPRDGEVRGGASLLRAYAKIVLLGACVGDDIVWRSAGRLRRARIEQLIFQPESSSRRETTRLRDTPPAMTRESQRTAP
jgi:regulator of nucleoside diphosphate kinase